MVRRIPFKRRRISSDDEPEEVSKSSLASSPISESLIGDNHQFSVKNEPFPSTSRSMNQTPNKTETDSGLHFQGTAVEDNLINDSDNGFDLLWGDIDQSSEIVIGTRNRTAENLVDTVKLLRTTLELSPKWEDFTPASSSSSYKVPGLEVTLQPHQEFAIKWMEYHESRFPFGGVLADDMGLGKTVDVIGLILHTKGAGNLEKQTSFGVTQKPPLKSSMTTLIVCPAGCLSQWKDELSQKAPQLSILAYHGSSRLGIGTSEFASNDVVISTYSTIASSWKTGDTRSNPLYSIHWQRVVLDEAHNLKNHLSETAISVGLLHADYRWAVTGTPIHNCLEDLYSIFKFLRVKPLDQLSIWRKIIGSKKLQPNAVNKLHFLKSTLILRREKNEIFKTLDYQFPEKTVQTIKLEMAHSERKLYRKVLSYANDVLNMYCSQAQDNDVAPKSNHASEHRPEAAQFNNLLKILLYLRQCVVLPSLMQDLEKYITLSKSDLRVMATSYVSSKIQKILEDVDEIRVNSTKNGTPMDKIIIVSSWTSVLNYVRHQLDSRKYLTTCITGNESLKKRQQNQVDFNEGDANVLLLSLTAGGVGLNLTGANHMLFVEPHWNPQLELQAQDRAHRMGQTKPVFIKRYITAMTIEEKIMSMQESKSSIASSLYGSTDDTILSGNTLRHLFSS